MQAIFVKQFLPLQVSHWFVLHKIVFINITAEEKPETKGKKVMGVGLGNIFEGGPIKLRSTAASAKRPVEKVSGSKYPHCQEIQCKKKADIWRCALSWSETNSTKITGLFNNLLFIRYNRKKLWLSRQVYFLYFFNLIFVGTYPSSSSLFENKNYRKYACNMTPK